MHTTTTIAHHSALHAISAQTHQPPAPLECRHGRTIPLSTRQRVLKRHHYKCAIPYCQRTETHDHTLALHHIRDHREGGANTEDNLIPLCGSKRKGIQRIGTCHYWADLHARLWPRDYLQNLIFTDEQAATLHPPASEEELRTRLHATQTLGPQQWNARLSTLLNIWHDIANAQLDWATTFELTAHAKREMSAVLTTSGPPGEQVNDPLLYPNQLPENRFAGIWLCKTALTLTKHLQSDRNLTAHKLRTDLTHAYVVHLNGLRTRHAYNAACRIFRRNSRDLLTHNQNTNPAWRGYVLSAYAIAAGNANGNYGRQHLRTYVNLADKSGDRHASLDAKIREIEGWTNFENPNIKKGLDLAERIFPDVETDFPILKVILRKLLFASLARTGSKDEAITYYTEAKNLAKDHCLHDQLRKLEHQRTTLENENKI